LFERYLNFIHGVSICPTGRLGLILATSSFICLVVLELARLLGIITSSYAGLVTYMLFPALFVVGLILILIGWYRTKKITGKSTRELINERFDNDAVKGDLLGSKLVRTIMLLTLVNVVFLTGISMRMFSFMDEPVFCGTACHSVMNPEWVTYQKSPHSRVACVQCHVGEGAGALIDSKLNGLWQMVSVTFDLLERPIPTPVHQLRPARQTCEKCHWPDRFLGSRLKTILHYDRDSASTLKYTTLNMKVDAGAFGKKAGIHWHVAEENQVRYASINDEREKIVWTEVLRPDGGFHKYTSKDLSQSEEHALTVRTMDCVDCHNRATHIYENPDRAIDERIRHGLIDRSLPFLKREALHAITSGYADNQAGLEGIANHINGFYQRNYPKLAQSKQFQIDSTIIVLQEIYSRNIHTSMNIEWGTYSSYIGHVGEKGCFRCHNSSLVDDKGNTISSDCALCHSILADGHENPFQFLKAIDTSEIDYMMHQYQQSEFLESFGNTQREE